jgi:lipopolysaccharide transport system ATP-binding protein
MTTFAIRAEGLGKKYIIARRQTERYNTFRDAIMRRFSGGENGGSEEFWALRDVSFDVKHGEVVGIIGRNGAGKSTLLKILSRITEPTEGRVAIRGRVASLLEVGTGFHPELTGRENIYLNGAILGMRREEIRRKFDEIVAFAEVDKFLDTPVKRYSSGMYVRLAFAVAAHLEPELLVVDEVLAVGDADFQKKCLGKMEDVSRKDGRTVLFVSHNITAIKRLCGRCLLLDHGKLAMDSNVDRTILEYAGRVVRQMEVRFDPRPDHPSITGVKVDEAGLMRGDLIVDLTFEAPIPLAPPVPGIVVASADGTPVFGSNPRFHPDGFARKTLSSGVVRMSAKQLPLSRGGYRLSVWLGDWLNDYDRRIDVLGFEFRPNATDSLKPPPDVIGYLDWPAHWEV